MMTMVSCTYDYHYPDYTGIRSKYTVADISPRLREQLLPIAMENGVTLKFASEQWRTVVTEKDSIGNIIYQGEPRERADNKTKIIEVSFICSCRLQSIDWTYYDICRFDFEKQFPIEITPLLINISVSDNDKFTVIKYPIYVYNVDSNLPVIEKVNSYGYELLDVKTIITEKDSDGDTIRSFEHRTIDGMIITTTAKAIDVEVALYGKPQNAADKVYIGSYYFKNIKLDGFNDTDGKTIILTEDMEHEFIENKNIPYCYNIDRNLPVIEKVNSYGYELLDVKTIITEKDSDGDTIRSFEHRAIDGMIYSYKGAVSIDVEISLYGKSQNSADKVYIGSYYFKNIKLKDINGTTLTLTENMGHEFIENLNL